MKKWTLFLLVLLSLTACNTAPDPAFVVASRLTYEALAPEYSAYVNADPALTVEQKVLRLDTLVRWDAAIKAREEVK